MATLNVEDRETECPVCHENYVEPKILPCTHLLCRNCLVNWVKTSTEAHCPLCRSAIYDLKDSNSRSSEDLADSLPTDYAMSAVVESYKIISQRQMCCLHTNVDAVSMCLQCSVMMCQSCADYHHAFPVTSSHKTENLATLTSERLAVLRQTPCATHPSKTSELFCPTHGVSICHLCASSKHRACQEVTDLNEMLDKHKQAFAEMEDKLTKAESNLNEILMKYEEFVLMAEKYMKESHTKIDSMCDDLIISVESCRNQLKKTLQDSNESFKASIQDRKSYLARRFGLLTSHKLLIQRLQQTASGSVQLAMVTMIQDRVKDLTSVLSLPSDTKPMRLAKLNIEEDEAPTRVKNELENISQMTVILPIRGPLENPWMFDNNCGSNIMLTNEGQTATVKDNTDLYNRLVMSSEPMSTNSLYEILVEETDTQYSGEYISIGVCGENTHSLTQLSYWFEMKTFVAVNSARTYSQGQRIKKYSCPALKTVKVGSRIGVMVDTSHSLHVYVDGKDQGVMAKNVTQPCYAMFDLLCFLNQVWVFSDTKLICLKTKCWIG